MTRTDHRGICVTGASGPAVDRFERSLSMLLCGHGGAEAACEAALADSPTFAMAHALHAYLHLSSSEAAGAERAAKILPRLRATARTGRERAHAAAIAAYAAGEFEAASERLDDILIEYPRDILALHQGHQLDFYRGDARNLRDRVARVRHAWSPSLPGHHGVLAMHAFGLEECGEYTQAEDAGREALAIEPYDGWAHHAVAHVMEMQGRRGEGVAWMRQRESWWAPDNALAVHNWWHLALLLLDSDRPQEALDLYDARIGNGRIGNARIGNGRPGPAALDLVDASALLWPLCQRGEE